MANQNMINALLEERRGYVTRGLDDRVAAVDEQLGHYGYEAPQEETSPEPSVAQQRAVSQSEGEPPKRRGRPPRSTAEQSGKDET